MHDLENPPQNNLTFWSNLMIIMWLEGSWGSCILGYNEVRANFWMNFRLSLRISIPPVYQADFQLQLRHVEAAAKSERDKMEDGSCWWSDPERSEKDATQNEESMQFLEVWRGNVHCSMRSTEKSWSLGNQSEHICTLSRSLLWLQDRTYCRPKKCDPICGPSMAS